MALAMVCKADQKLPKKVKESFESRYKGATDVLWSFVDENLSINFQHDESARTAIYTPEGVWLQTTTSIEDSKIPECIIEKITGEYMDVVFDQASVVETPESMEYEIMITSSEEELLDSGKTRDVIQTLILRYGKNCSFLGEKPMEN